MLPLSNTAGTQLISQAARPSPCHPGTVISAIRSRRDLGYLISAIRSRRDLVQVREHSYARHASEIAALCDEAKFAEAFGGAGKEEVVSLVKNKVRDVPYNINHRINSTYNQIVHALLCGRW